MRNFTRYASLRRRLKPSAVGSSGRAARQRATSFGILRRARGETEEQFEARERMVAKFGGSDGT